MISNPRLPRLLPALTFNSLPLIDDQSCAITASALHAIGELFMHHHMEGEYDIGLLHRHFDLREGQIMLHQTIDNGVDICKPCYAQNMDASQLVPHAFYLDADNEFRPFEYEISASTFVPSAEFFRELGRMLNELRLRNVLVVQRRPKLKIDAFPLTEISVLQSTPELRSIPRYKESTDEQEQGKVEVELYDSVVTSWGFTRGDSGIEAFATKACRKDSIGRHLIVEA